MPKKNDPIYVVKADAKTLDVIKRKCQECNYSYQITGKYEIKIEGPVTEEFRRYVRGVMQVANKQKYGGKK